MILVHGEDPPSDDEWSRYLVFLKSRPDLPRMRSLAITDGGAPTPAQRKKLNEIIGGTQGCSAVVSASAFVRGVVTALAWFNPMIKAFAPAERESAFRHLRLDAHESAEIGRLIERLRVELRGGPRAS